MQSIIETLIANTANDGDAIAFSDADRGLTRRQFLDAVGGLAARLDTAPQTIGILLPNGVAWAVALTAAAVAGKTVVPLPTFFSAGQIAHILANAGVELILSDGDSAPTITDGRVPELIVDIDVIEPAAPKPKPGFGVIIYTSGSTGAPKGVRLGSRQIAWSTAALAEASGATAADSYLSLLPLPLLLEMISAVFVPIKVGGRTTFDRETAAAIGRGEVRTLAPLFERHQPTTSVLLPQLLRIWVAELAARRQSAPKSLRFVAVGGAPVPAPLASAAWDIGIPIHEGYGLSECCSVVALNRPGQRVAGTVGHPLPGLNITLDGGEIIVSGPSVTDGYLGQPDHHGVWHTGDLGQFDESGNLVVLGRKDSLIVNSYGRNISPEWVETALLADPRLALVCVAGGADGGLTALLMPAKAVEPQLLAAGEVDLVRLVGELTADLPIYARPQRAQAISIAEARAHGLITDNGRVRRSAIAAFLLTWQAKVA